VHDTGGEDVIAEEYSTLSQAIIFNIKRYCKKGDVKVGYVMTKVHLPIEVM
jgi:hypothetical protein